jgi:hypothetical protein
MEKYVSYLALDYNAPKQSPLEWFVKNKLQNVPPIPLRLSVLLDFTTVLTVLDLLSLIL